MGGCDDPPTAEERRFYVVCARSSITLSIIVKVFINRALIPSAPSKYTGDLEARPTRSSVVKRIAEPACLLRLR